MDGCLGLLNLASGFIFISLLALVVVEFLLILVGTFIRIQGFLFFKAFLLFPILLILLQGVSVLN